MRPRKRMPRGLHSCRGRERSGRTEESDQRIFPPRRALYSGHARLWQGDAVLEADSIELLRETKVLNAAGNVRAVFPQAESRMGGVQMGATRTAAKKSQLWHASAETLTYSDAENRARLERN